MQSRAYSLPLLKLIFLCLLIGLIQGCNNDSDKNESREFLITVTNLTNNQPFSPITGIVSTNNTSLFSIGDVASISLEKLAESGDNQEILTQNDSTISGDNLLLPGKSDNLKLEANITSEIDVSLGFTLLAMLVNTNDGFIGINNIDISKLQKEESMVVYSKIYDAGTEGNSEATTDVPGQSGEGFNSMRDDRNFIAIHPGIIGEEEGLSTSALNMTHRFDNPGAKVVVTRIN